jgi:hypothetical protein
MRIWYQESGVRSQESPSQEERLSSNARACSLWGVLHLITRRLEVWGYCIQSLPAQALELLIFLKSRSSDERLWTRRF